MSYVNNRLRLQEEVRLKTVALEEAENANRSAMGQLVRKMNMMKQESGAKDMEALERTQELERHKDKVQRLETALQTAMKEIERKNDLAGWWEAKAGEQQQQLSELERYF